MIAAGDVINGSKPSSCLVTDQAKSIQSAGYDVFFGLVNDRKSLKGIFRNIRRLRMETNNLRPSVIHAQYGSVISFVASRLNKDIPLVISFSGSDLIGVPIPGLKWKFRNLFTLLISWWASCSAKIIIVKSTNLLNFLPPILKKKAVVIPNGVDTDLFRPLFKKNNKDRLKFKNDKKIVLFHASAGHNQTIKNSELAYNSVKILSEKDPSLKLLLISKFNREEVSTIMNIADCLIVTSLHEGSPNIVKEAMACNLPVVSVPCGDVEERLKKVYPGGVYDYNAYALADGIRDVINSGIRSNGREEIVRQDLTAPKIAKTLIQIYNKVID